MVVSSVQTFLIVARSGAATQEQLPTRTDVFWKDGARSRAAGLKNLFIILPNEERSTWNPFGCLCEADLRRVFGIFDRDRCAEIVVFPFAVLASDVDKAFSVDPVGALHRDLRNR